MNLKKVLDEVVLPSVEKPSRYLGTELNSIHKSPDAVEVRLALVFPDLYDLGLGNLGLHILYAIANALPWCWAERAYSPAVDMDAALRAAGLPLFALESKDPLSEFDGLGITLQSELTYTNILGILDLSGIPLRAADRTDDHPLVFAGGPAVFNPEPLALFIDFFLIGDGEEAIVEIVEVLRSYRGHSRAEKLEAMAALEGVYVPSLYPFITTEEGRILPDPDAPKIRKRLTRDLNGATFPVDYIVPFTKQVHDRVSLEVLRGCTQGCRFCQAGMTTRPVRERKIENITDLMERTLANTGYEEISLVSLSTCDYSQVQKMVAKAAETARAARASVSLPSLRLDSFSVELADMVAETRRSGITFAPEAASPRLRSIINKWIPDDELLNMSAGAYTLGWEVVKLYFMIGLPTERDDDIEAIADLAIRTVRQGREIRPKAKVNLGVSTFVPKPFTPFQWAAQIGRDETNRRQKILSNRLGRTQGIRFGRHEAHETWIEGLISRSDRRVGELLERAYRNGARFDAWNEHANVGAWEEAIEETGFDVADAFRERTLDEVLPWDHLDILVERAWFVEDWRRAMELKWAPDCRHKKCHQCGVIDVERELCAAMLRDNVKGRRAEKDFVIPPSIERVEPDPVQRLWFRYARTGNGRFLSHLEAANAWMRAFRRARLPMAYSRGFHPRARMAFSAALPAGFETVGDYIEVMLTEAVDPIAILDRLKDRMPEGFRLLSAREMPLRTPALMSLVCGGEYSLSFPNVSMIDLARKVEAVRRSASLEVERKAKRGKRRIMTTIDIRPSLQSLTWRSADVPTLDAVFVNTDGVIGKVRDLLGFLTDEPEMVRVLRRETLLHSDETFEAPSMPLEEAPAGC